MICQETSIKHSKPIREYCYNPEEVPMTLQVGLVGTNGIVLASDCLVGRSHVKHLTSKYSKISTRKDQKVISCWSGDEYPSTQLVKEVFKRLSGDDLSELSSNIPESILETSFGADIVKYDSAEAMAVTISSTPKLYEIRLRRDGTKGSVDRACVRIQDKCIMGHRANAATFYTEHYYRKCPVENLVRLAAHTITTGSMINPNGIGGLEIIICTERGFEHVPESRIDELLAWSHECDERVKGLIFSN